MLGLGLGLNRSCDTRTYFEKLNAVNIFADVPLTTYAKSTNKWITIIRDSDGLTLDVGYDTVSRANALTWSTGTDSYIVDRWTQVKGKPSVNITNASLQQLAITGGAWIVNATKYCLYEPFASSISVNDNLQSVNSRMKNKSLAQYIILKNSKDGLLTSRGYTPDYCSFIKCSTGLMDVSVNNANNLFWHLADNTISTAIKPAKSMSAGVSYIFNTYSATVTYVDNATDIRFIGSLKDFDAIYGFSFAFNNNITGDLNDLSRIKSITLAATPLVTGDTLSLKSINADVNISSNPQFTGKLSDFINASLALNLSACILITGNLSDINYNRVNGNLILNDCALITGDLSQTENKLTTFLQVSNCNLITGNLNTISKISNSLKVNGCPLILGVYTPLTVPPTTSDFTGSGMSTSDIDNTLIAYANATVKNNGTFTATGKNRTVLSDTAVATLTSRGWTISGITRI